MPENSGRILIDDRALAKVSPPVAVIGEAMQAHLMAAARAPGADQTVRAVSALTGFVDPETGTMYFAMIAAVGPKGTPIKTSFLALTTGNALSEAINYLRGGALGPATTQQVL